MAVTAYPVVLDEFTTIARLREGRSIARWGDGECKMARGESYVREVANPLLAEELRTMIAHPHERCLVGIPRLDKRSPKYANWVCRAPAFLPFLSPDIDYVSSFITRPDSAPWIVTPGYAEALQSVWQGKKVAIICEPTSKLLTVGKRTARKLWHIPCPSHGAYAMIDEFEAQIVHGHPDVALLSHGVSATCLAHRLAHHGIQALDLGSIGGFLVRMLPVERLSPSYPAAVRHPECHSATALRAKLEACGFEVSYCGEGGTC